MIASSYAQFINVLLVEDSPVESKVLNLLLAQHGCRVTSAATLQDGISRLGTDQIDVILLDLSLPDSDGLNTLFGIQACSSDLPVVVLTGTDDERMALEAIQCGAQDYLIKGKPSDASLVRCLRYAIERKQIEQRVKDINAELERRVLERTTELARSNAELQQFSRIAAHDLQEPLRVIQGYAQLLTRRYRGQMAEEAQQFIDYITDGTKRMAQLIQDVLDHSKIGERRSQLALIDTSEPLTDALCNLRAAIADSGAEIMCGPMPRLLCNKAELVALLQNLIGNAIKYRGIDPPVISVSAERQDEDWVFSVKDNGIGIEPRFHKQIFEMFRRLHGRDKYPGTGIGLAICKKIVDSHHGKIWVESEYGSGATFRFTLPAEEAHMSGTLNILLVEDSPADARLTQEALRDTRLDVAVTTVSDGEQAIHYLRQKQSIGKPPDVILLDLNMPRKNGQEVLAEMKTEPAFDNIPVIVLTVSQQEEEILKALDTRMNYYINKPVTPDRLEALLKMIGQLWYET